MGTHCSVPLSSPPWYASFFLDPGVRWCRMLTGDVMYVHAVPWIALGLHVARSLLESQLAGPVGLYLNVADRTHSHPQSNALLNRSFNQCGHPGQETLEKLAKQIGWSTYNVHKWFIRARHYGKPSQLTKFKESSWRMFIYALTSLSGLYLLPKEDFFWDLKKCYAGFPGNTPSDRVMGYWALQLGFYISLLISHRLDVRRNDHMLMVVHHLVTVLMLAICYVVNGVQIGVLIVLTHDLSDVPLELAKLLKYAQQNKSAQVVFIVFGVVFLVTRLLLFPFFLLYSALMHYPVVVSHSPAYWSIIFMLLMLQVMHVYWFYLIAQMMWSLVISKETAGDLRSGMEYQAPIIETEEEYTYWSDSQQKKSK